MKEIFNNPQVKIVSGLEKPELADQVMALMQKTWPKFILNDPLGSQYWIELYLHFPDFQLLYMNTQTNEIYAIANSIPAHLNIEPHQLSDRGWHWCIEKGFDDFHAHRSLNTQFPLAVTVPLKYQAAKLGGFMVRQMKAVGLARKFKYFLAPLRPNQKAHYPLSSFENYVSWRRSDGLPFDAWMRAHWRIGARPIKPCHKSLVIEGSVSDWEDWSGLELPQSGQYIVPGALMPVKINIEDDLGVYEEPNLWMQHPME